jgi:RNA polymerase sigma-70 factor (ECF subfamily)
VRPAISFDYDPEPPLADRVAASAAPVDTADSEPPVQPGPAATDASEPQTFLDLYETHLSFVWNGVRRLGVPESAVEDVVQEVFLVVHRKLGDFEGRSSLKTWLFGIALRVVRHHRRRQRSQRYSGEIETHEVDALVDPKSPSPQQSAESGQMRATLHRLLDELDDEKREVLVLAELEQMTAPEIAEVTGTNLNTVYWRLRMARQEFERLVTRLNARKERGLR